MPDVASKVIGIIAAKGQVDPELVKPESKLAELGITSLDVVEIVFALEEAFGIEIPFNANKPGTGSPEFERVSGVIAAVEGLVAAQGQAS